MRRIDRLFVRLREKIAQVTNGYDERLRQEWFDLADKLEAEHECEIEKARNQSLRIGTGSAGCFPSE